MRHSECWWSCRKEDEEVCEKNLIYKDLSGDGIAYAARENHPNILHIMDEAIQEGTPVRDWMLILSLSTQNAALQKRIWGSNRSSLSWLKKSRNGVSPL